MRSGKSTVYMEILYENERMNEKAQKKNVKNGNLIFNREILYENERMKENAWRKSVNPIQNPSSLTAYVQYLYCTVYIYTVSIYVYVYMYCMNTGEALPKKSYQGC